MSAIVDVIARESVDSRGNPTVEADVLLERGMLVFASIFDLAVDYSDRETDIAKTELFVVFQQDFIPAYRHGYPLDSGYNTRKVVLILDNKKEVIHKNIQIL